MKRMARLLWVLILLVGCAPQTSNESELTDQIHKLNNEVIGYIDELEAKDEVIEALEKQVATLESNIVDLREALDAKPTAVLRDGAEQEEPASAPEPGVVLKAALTEVIVGGGRLSLMGDEASIPYDDMGRFSETLEKMVNAGGQSKYHKTIYNDAIKIVMEGTDAEVLSIVRMELISDLYGLGDGIHVGSPKSELESYLKALGVEVAHYADQVMEVYQVDLGGEMTVLFRVEDTVQYILIAKE